MKKIAIWALPLLFFGTSIFADGWHKGPNIPKRYEPFIHYAVHVAIDSLIGDVVLGVMEAVDPVALRFDKYSISKDSSAFSFFYGLGYISALYIRYKTPQWTDTHFLGLDTQRSRKQNIIRFMHRLFFKEAGVLTGEYFARCCEASSLQSQTL